MNNFMGKLCVVTKTITRKNRRWIYSFENVNLDKNWYIPHSIHNNSKRPHSESTQKRNISIYTVYFCVIKRWSFAKLDMMCEYWIPNGISHWILNMHIFRWQMIMAKNKETITLETWKQMKKKSFPSHTHPQPHTRIRKKKRKKKYSKYSKNEW